MASVGKISVQVGMNTAEVRAGAKQVGGHIRGMNTDISESARSFRSWQRDAKRVFAETRTDAERYSAEVAKLSAMHKRGYIDATTYARALNQVSLAYATPGPIIAQVVTPMMQLETTMGKVTAAAAPLGAAFGVMLGPIGAAIIAIGTLKKSLTVGEEFNQAMRSSTAIMPDVDESMFRRMEQAAFNASQARPQFNPTEYAKGFYYLASAGLDANRQIAALPVVADFAASGMFDLSRATDILTDAQSALGLSSADAGTYMKNMTMLGDTIATAAARSNATVEQFGEALMGVGGSAIRRYKVEVQEATAAMMVWADTGFAKGEAASEQMYIMLRELVSAAGQNTTAMKLFADSAGNLRPLVDIVADLEKQMKGMGTVERQIFLESTGIPKKSSAAISALIGFSDQLRKYEGYLDSANGAMDRMADRQLPPLTKAWKELKNTLSELASIASTGPLSGLAEVISPITTGVQGLNDAIRQTQLYVTQAVLGFAEFAQSAKIIPDALAGADYGMIGNTAARLTGFRDIMGAMGSGGEGYVESLRAKVKELQDELNGVAGAGSAAADATAGIGDAAAEAADGLGDIADAEKALESAGKSIADLEKEIRQFGMTASEIAMDDFVNGMKDAGDAAGALIERYRELLDQRDEMNRLKDEEKEAEKSATDERKQMYDSILDDNKRLMDEYKRQMDEGKKLAEQFRTPAEKASEEIADIQRLLDVGAIDKKTAARAAMASIGDSIRRNELPTAMIRGSQEEYNAGLQGEQKNRQARMLKAVEDQLNEAIEQRRLLESMERIWRGVHVVGAPP